MPLTVSFFFLAPLRVLFLGGSGGEREKEKERKRKEKLGMDRVDQITLTREPTEMTTVKHGRAVCTGPKRFVESTK